MQSQLLETLLGQGPLHALLIALALIGLVLAVCIWVMEFSGWTISTRGFVRNGMRWDATSIALVAVCAAIYIAGRPIQIQFIPGIGGFNPSLSVAQTFAVLFGLPGAVGVTFSMPIGDAISGALTLGSVAGFLSHTFITWIPYKLAGPVNLRSWRFWLRFYVFGIILAPIAHAIVIPGWLDFTHVVPTAVAWGAVTLAILTNQGLLPAILSPIFLGILYPIVKRRGLYWRDRYGSQKKPPEQPQVATT